MEEGALAARTDSYFLKTKAIVEHFGDRAATYAVFMRRPVICTPRLAVEFLEEQAASRGVKFHIELMKNEGEAVGAGEPLMYITGPLYHLVDLETLLLQKIGPSCVAAYNARRCARNCRGSRSSRWMRGTAPAATCRR
jgi:nicotinate phosphoribosyltransferase